MKTISLALFGTGNKYAQYVSACVLANLNLFPRDEGWIIKFHIDDAITNTAVGCVLSKMVDRGLIVVRQMGSAPLTRAMLWRMAPIWDVGVNYVFCRDLDAPPMPRDRVACEQFVKSGYAVGTILDNVAHIDIMGGLCQFNATAFRLSTGLHSIDDLYHWADHSDAEYKVHGLDQLVLNRLILRPSGPTMLEHRYNGWLDGPNKLPARSAGRYLNPAWSTPIPDIGKSKLSPELTAEADLLGAHLGVAGYDHQRAFQFWIENGDAELATEVLACR
jgi:hypothetical protein